MKANNRKQLFLLSFSMVIVMLGYGMIIPIIPFYIEKLGASGSQLGLLAASFSIMQFIFAPVWGNISDRIGRKPILLLGLIGDAVSMLIFGLANQLWLLFAARSITGILSSATLPTAMAYVSDSTTEEDRSRGIGWLGAAMGLGVILGPGIGGWLAGGSLSLPFFLASGLSILAAILTYIMLPESKPEVVDGSLQEKKSLFQFQSMWQALKSPIGILMFISFLVSFGLTNFEAIFGLYALEKFNYGPEQVGTILMVIAIVSTIGKAALTGPATRRWGEAKIIKGSLLISSLGFIALLLANTYITILLATGFFILSKTLLRPAVLSLTSKQTDSGQGTAMGLNNAFMSLGRIIGPVWAGFVFDINIEWPYISGVIIMFIGFIISLVTIRFSRHNGEQHIQKYPMKVS